jgi:hypothetical protein
MLEGPAPIWLAAGFQAAPRAKPTAAANFGSPLAGESACPTALLNSASNAHSFSQRKVETQAGFQAAKVK